MKIDCYYWMPLVELHLTNLTNVFKWPNVRLRENSTGYLQLIFYLFSGMNLALKKPAWQSSDFCGGVASRAVDGNRNPDINMAHCTHTADNNPPWITVDLEEAYEITEVAITNRGDCCCKFKHMLTSYLRSILDWNAFFSLTFWVNGTNRLEIHISTSNLPCQ